MSQVAIFMYTFQNYMKSKSLRKGALSPTGVFFSCPGNSDIATLIWVQDAILGGVTKEFRFSGRLRTQWLLFQRIHSQHLHVTSSAIPVPDTHKRVPRSPGCTWCTDMYADKISIHIKKKKNVWAFRLFTPPTVHPQPCSGTPTSALKSRAGGSKS